MKKTVAILTLSMLFALLAAQEKPSVEQQKAMEAYMKAGAVTGNHEFLKKYAGSWDCQVKGWMAPGQPPTISQGTFQGEMRLDGRFLFMDFKGEMFGQPFVGLQIIGFDNMQQKYVSLWLDNTSTMMFMTTGTRQDNVISETGLWPDPVSGDELPVKARTTWVGADEYLYEQFMIRPDKSEFKSMEMSCKRRR